MTSFLDIFFSCACIRSVCRLSSSRSVGVCSCWYAALAALFSCPGPTFIANIPAVQWHQDVVVIFSVLWIWNLPSVWLKLFKYWCHDVVCTLFEGSDVSTSSTARRFMFLRLIQFCMESKWDHCHLYHMLNTSRCRRCSPVLEMAVSMSSISLFSSRLI